MSARVLLSGSVCAFALAFAARASAQDSATAGALFEKGVADMQAAHFETGCPALEESQRIDPRPGTLFTLAECEAHWGKVATATARYQEYLDVVSQLAGDQQRRHKARADIARAQLAKLKPTVPTLALTLPKNAPPGTSVTRNGEALNGAALGLPLPVDPGDYVIVTRAPGAPANETKVSVQLGEAKNIQLELAAASAPAAASSTPDAASAKIDLQAPPEPTDAGHGTGRKTAAYVVGGVGVAGIVVGSITGALVLGKKSKVNDGCTAGVCNQSGLDAANSAETLGTVSDIGFGVGIAGLAVSAVLLLTGSDANAEHAHAPAWQPLVTSARGGVMTGVSHAF